MQNMRRSRGTQQRQTARDVGRQPKAFQNAYASAFGQCRVATALTEGEQHSICYANPAFLELVGQTDDLGVGHPLIERFPELVPFESGALLDRVRQTSHAESMDGAPYAHPRRGQLFLNLTAWPCGRANALTLIQFVEAMLPQTNVRDTRFEDLTRDMRAVNERLVVAGVEQQERAQEADRRLAVAEQAVERSESALQSNVVQTQSLARRLITAQEAERIRLARELHDDVNQQLAGLSIELSTLRASLPASAGAIRVDLDHLQQCTTVLIDTIRNLSHELHPGTLRVAGLLPALRSLCGEMEKKDGRIDFCTTIDELSSLPDDIALTLYRVAQEALRNVIQHAHADHTSVVLARDVDHICLRIMDDGRGFARNDIGRGLGLLSMEERVLGVNGELTIESIPHIGTRIELSIPIPLQSTGTASPSLAVAGTHATSA